MLIGLILIAIAGIIVYNLIRPPLVEVENKYCNNAEDCRVTSCMDCVNVNQEEMRFCERPAYELNFTLKCECINFQCQVVKVPKTTAGTIAKNSGGSAALIAECANKSYIYDNSDVIIIGNVSKVETKQENQIYTYSTISIENFVKGNLTSNTVTIKTPGGCIGTTCMAVEDQPIFHENKLVKIYLKQTDNEFSIFCSIMGVEEVGHI
jgi:hypothetical protein